MQLLWLIKNSEGAREPCLRTKVTSHLLCLTSRVRRKGRTSQDAPLLRRLRFFFNLPSEFPDLDAIHSLTSKGIHHPQISVSPLQRVGHEVCGLLCSKVAEDKLLKPEAMMDSEGGGSTQVVNGS
jgi:hypothetical protein